MVQQGRERRKEQAAALTARRAILPAIDDATLHIVLPFVTMIFTAGGFYIYVRMSIKHIEEKQEQDRIEANAKADKNFETLDIKIDKNQKELLADVSGVGAKVGRIERDGLRRYHNTSVAMMLTVSPKDEGKVAALLKEEN